MLLCNVVWRARCYPGIYYIRQHRGFFYRHEHIWAHSDNCASVLCLGGREAGRGERTRWVRGHSVGDRRQDGAPQSMKSWGMGETRGACGWHKGRPPLRPLAWAAVTGSGGLQAPGQTCWLGGSALVPPASEEAGVRPTEWGQTSQLSRSRQIQLSKKPKRAQQFSAYYP